MFTTAPTDARPAHRRLALAATTLVGLLALASCGGEPQPGRADRTASTSTASASTSSTSTTSTSTTSAPPTSTATAPTSTTSTSTTSTSTTSTSTTSTVPAATRRPTEPVDVAFGPPGARVHIRCTGGGDATVLLIAGFEAGSDSWALTEPALAQVTRVCTYDRPGTGTSDPPVSTQTFRTQARDLYAMLADLGEPGPYVVVGHSFGGAEAATFASTFLDEVAAVVLVDASPVTWPTVICDVVDDGSTAAAMLRGLCEGWADPTRNVEHLDVFEGFEQASAIASLGSLPLTVITAVERTMPDGLSENELDRLTAAWNSGQQHWQLLSTNSRAVPVVNTGHQIQLEHPELVIDEIVRLLP